MPGVVIHTCLSCGHTGTAADFIPGRAENGEAVPDSFVCRDADACLDRWAAREGAGQDA